MSKQIINIGNSPNDGNGEPARSAFNKTNKNFDEVYSALGGGSGIIPPALPIAKGGTGATTVEGAAAAIGAIGAGQSFSPVARSIDTTYINSTGRAIALYIRYESDVSLAGYRFALVISGFMVWQSTATQSNGGGIFAIIPDGASYSLTGVSGSKPNSFTTPTWMELR